MPFPQQFAGTRADMEFCYSEVDRTLIGPALALTAERLRTSWRRGGDAVHANAWNAAGTLVQPHDVSATQWDFVGALVSHSDVKVAASVRFLVGLIVQFSGFAHCYEAECAAPDAAFLVAFVDRARNLLAPLPAAEQAKLPLHYHVDPEPQTGVAWEVKSATLGTIVCVFSGPMEPSEEESPSPPTP